METTGEMETADSYWKEGRKEGMLQGDSLADRLTHKPWLAAKQPAVKRKSGWVSLTPVTTANTLGSVTRIG